MPTKDRRVYRAILEAHAKPDFRAAQMAEKAQVLKEHSELLKGHTYHIYINSELKWTGDAASPEIAVERAAMERNQIWHVELQPVQDGRTCRSLFPKASSNEFS